MCNAREAKSDAGVYRYGFNGKENDNEVKGEGNQVEFEARTYDPRLGVFLSRDPLAEKYPSQSPYVFAANSPVQFVDVLGMGPGPSFIGWWVGDILKDFPFFTETGKRNKRVLINSAEKAGASFLGVVSGLTPGPRRSAESIGLYVHQDWFEGGADVGEAGAPATSLLSGGSGMAPKLAVSMGSELKMAKPLGLSINITSTLLANSMSNPEGTEGVQGSSNSSSGESGVAKRRAAFERFSPSWARGSQSSALKKFADGVRGVLSADGVKTRYTNSKTNIEVIVDNENNYFRIFDKNRGQYIGMDGKVPSTGRLQGQEAKDHVQKQTHFVNQD